MRWFSPLLILCFLVGCACAGDTLRSVREVRTLDANVAATGKPMTDILNISTNTEIPLNDVYKKIEGLLSKEVPPTQNPPKKGDTMRLVLDNKKAASVLGWQPKVGIDEGLQKTVEWFKARTQ